LERMESQAWSFRADRCATPAVFARGGGLLTTETSPLGQSGVGFAYVDGRPLLRLHFPYREEPLRYFGHDVPALPDVRVHRREPGETQTLRFERHGGGWERVLRGAHARGRTGEHPGWGATAGAAEAHAWGRGGWH